MSTKQLVSIITPAYNVEKFISDTVKSVIDQTYEKWELLIIDNNSTDKTKDQINKFNDERVKYFFEEKQGVGYARNVGLANMKGDFFCFLDGDDVFTPQAISSRLQVFESNPELSFVDGGVTYVNNDMHPLLQEYKPSFTGRPFDQLLRLNSNCLFGNTWMIKRNGKEEYRFDTEMTHAEDLFFYLTISKDKQYSYTNETVLLYRQRNDSAMRNLRGLELGYILLLKKIKSDLGQKSWTIVKLKLKIMKIMVLSHLFDGRDILAAIKAPFKILTA